jgi:hypothetical protein
VDQIQPVQALHVERAAAGRRYGGPMASVKQFQVTFDCAEPERVARFWCDVLGYVVPPPPEGFATWDDYDRLAQHACDCCLPMTTTSRAS